MCQGLIKSLWMLWFWLRLKSYGCEQEKVKRFYPSIVVFREACIFGRATSFLTAGGLWSETSGIAFKCFPEIGVLHV